MFSLSDKELRKIGGLRMFVDDKPLPEIEKKLNELGLRIAVFNPCANKPETGDFLSVMNLNIEGLYPEH
jgi:zinc transport system substrate-binding protein